MKYENEKGKETRCIEGGYERRKGKRQEWERKKREKKIKELYKNVYQMKRTE